MESIRQGKRKIQEKDEGEELTGEGVGREVCSYWPSPTVVTLSSYEYLMNYPHLKPLLHRSTFAHYPQRDLLLLQSQWDHQQY